MSKNWKDFIPPFIRSKLYRLHFALLRQQNRAKYRAWANAPGIVADDGCDSLELFSKFVKIVHLEIDRYCNRSCVYCANHKLPCRREHSPMPDEIYEKCVKELSLISYDAFVEFNGFNEPLADLPLLFKRIKTLKQNCPKSRLLINSNGDFLDQNTFDMLAEAGVNYMMVTLHLSQNEVHLSESERLKKIELFQQRLPDHNLVYAPDTDTWQNVNNGLLLIVRVSNFVLTGHNFAGCAGKKVKREVPCYVPLLHYYVDYAGRVSFCCSTNMDAPECNSMIMGNAEENTIFELFSSPQARKLRQALLTMKNMPPCCAVCDAQTVYCMNTVYQKNPYYPFFEQ